MSLTALTRFSLIVSDEPVLRDQFYDGNMKTERGAANSYKRVNSLSIAIIFCVHERSFVFLPPGAVVLRLARSWFRIGSLEILSRSGELDLLR